MIFRLGRLLNGGAKGPGTYHLCRECAHAAFLYIPQCLIVHLSTQINNSFNNNKINFLLIVTWKMFRYILCAALYRVLPESGPKDNHTWRASSRGAFQHFLIISLQSSDAQVLTKDSVTVSVDAVVYYRVSNATVSVANVENAHHSTR